MPADIGNQLDARGVAHQRAAGADDHHVLEVLGAEQRGHCLRAALHLDGPGRVGADRLDADQVLEVLPQAWQLGAQPGTQLVDVHGSRLGRGPGGRLAGLLVG